MKYFVVLKYHRYAVLVWLAFIILALAYSIITPPFEMGDETRHYAVVKYMADTGKLPIQEPGEAQYHWSHEGNQPPLYYALLALVTSWIDTGTWQDVYWYNPHTTVGVPLRPDNKNMTIHTDQETFPWQDYTLAVRLGRWVSISLEAVTVAVAYLIALQLFQGQRWLSVATMSLTAFTPMFIFISSAINNDNLVVMICTVTLWRLIRLAQGEPTWGQIAWLGIWVGLGTLSKLYAWGLLPLTGLVLLWHGYQTRAWGRMIGQGLFFGGMVFLVAGWWYIRNIILYGDVTTLSLMSEVAGARRAPLTLSIFLSEFEGFRIAYWALFGGVNVIAPAWIYTALDIITVLGILGLFAFGLILLVGQRGLWRRFSLLEQVKPAALLLLLAWSGIMVSGYTLWNFSQPASQGRLLYPAIVALSSLLALGLCWYWPVQLQAWPITMLGSSLFVFALISPWLYIAPAYAKPDLHTLADIPNDIQHLDYVFGEEIRLIGVAIPSDTYRATEVVPITAYWEVLRRPTKNYSIFIHLYGRDHQALAQLDTYPGLGAWPTTLLKLGNVVIDTYHLTLSPQAEAEAPLRLQLVLGLYEYDQLGYPRLPVANIAGQTLDNPLAGEVKLRPWAWPQPISNQPLDISFADGIGLKGYDTTCHTQSGPCELILYWTTYQSPAQDYQVFIQLWQNNEHKMGFDQPLVGGDYPSQWWEAGEVIVDRHAIDLPILTGQAGGYRLRLGLYHLETGQRLAASDKNGVLVDFAVDIALD